MLLSYKNALAERVNGIIKNEFSPELVYKNHKEAKDNIGMIVKNYNTKRPHASLDYLTPDQARGISGYLNKRWKQYPIRQKRKHKGADKSRILMKNGKK